VGIKIYNLVNNKVWTGQDRINLVISNGLTVLTYDPIDDGITTINLPDNLYIDVGGGYGKYRLGAVSELGQLEKKKELLPETIQFNLAIPVDGWISGALDKTSTEKEAKNAVLKIVFSALQRKTETNLTTWDLLRLWIKVRGVKPSHIESLDYSKLNVLRPDTLVDKTPIFVLVSENSDLIIKKHFEDKRLQGERYSLEVLNGTSHPGLADEAARILGNIGGEVVGVGNTQTPFQQCFVRSEKNKSQTYTVRKIREIFACSWEEKTDVGRADISLILGESYRQNVYSD
jgi:hypothetical protein